jgi:hypothetical protein
MLFFFFIHIFKDLNFCPSLIDKFSLIILETLPSFLLHAKVPLDVQQLQIWYAVMQIYLASKLDLWNRFYSSSTFNVIYGFHYLANLCSKFGT